MECVISSVSSYSEWNKHVPQVGEKVDQQPVVEWEYRYPQPQVISWLILYLISDLDPKE